jgi:uncharacterized protein YndB with AHSA1/START domain
MPKSADASLVLVVRRTIAAAPERLFDAWTRPEQLRQWWGPAGVTCTAAEIDLRPGGSYRIANQFPGGRVLWISGEFFCIERPRELGYTWRLGSQHEPYERVTVRFERRGPHTEVIVTHERIRDVTDRERHEQGWAGCLQGLDAYIARGDG